MDSDNEFYYDESSDAEEGAGHLHINGNVNINESPECPPPQPESPSPIPPAPIPVGSLSPVWERTDDGTNILHYSNRADVLELKNLGN